MDLCSSCGSAGKESACHVGELGSIPGLGRSPGEEKGHLLQYSGLENSMDCMVHGVTKSWTRLSDFHFHGWIPTVSPCPHLLCPGQLHSLSQVLWVVKVSSSVDQSTVFMLQQIPPEVAYLSRSLSLTG